MAPLNRPTYRQRHWECAAGHRSRAVGVVAADGQALDTFVCAHCGGPVSPLDVELYFDGTPAHPDPES